MPVPNINTPHKASCHCGAVQFEVELTDGLNTARRCTCSICRMRGAVAVSAQLAGLNLLGVRHARELCSSLPDRLNLPVI